MSKILNKVTLWLAIALGASLICNIVQYKVYHREPIIDTVIERDTIITVDTVYHVEYKDTTIYQPQPVVVDTVLDIRIYRDTIYHNYGWTSFESTTHGTLLSQNIGFQFSVPEYYRTRTITNTVINTVRNNMMFVHGGAGYSLEGKLFPMAGATYIWGKHRRILTANYTFIDKRIEVMAGFSLWR